MSDMDEEKMLVEKQLEIAEQKKEAEDWVEIKVPIENEFKEELISEKIIPSTPKVPYETKEKIISDKNPNNWRWLAPMLIITLIVGTIVGISYCTYHDGRTVYSENVPKLSTQTIVINSGGQIQHEYSNAKVGDGV
jgi:hypothetical protein